VAAPAEDGPTAETPAADGGEGGDDGTAVAESDCRSVTVAWGETGCVAAAESDATAEFDADPETVLPSSSGVGVVLVDDEPLGNGETEGLTESRGEADGEGDAAGEAETDGE
jgi:hypothetical protein